MGPDVKPRIARSVPQSVREPRPGDSKAHVAFVKTLPCFYPGCPLKADDPHHLQRGVDNLPKGTSRTSPDRWAIPSCRGHHTGLFGFPFFIHMTGDDEAFLSKVGIDGRALANSLWSNTGDFDACVRLIERAKAGANLKAAEHAKQQRSA